MTIMLHHIDIGCNECGDWRQVAATTPAKARRKLRADRWMTIREEGRLNDLCPVCAEQYRAVELERRAERQRDRQRAQAAARAAAKS